MKKILRIKGIVFLLVIIAILVILSFIFTDRWMENRLENFGSAIVGAKVEFDGVHFSLADLQMKWNRLQVTDPRNTMSNLFETAECGLDIDPLPLLAKKLNIENITVKGLKFNTTRESDGKLDEAEKQALQEEMPEVIRELHQHLKEETANMPIFTLGQLTQKMNLDSIYTLLDLKSPQKIDSLKAVSLEKYQLWEKRISELPGEEDFRNLEAQVKSIDPNKLTRVDEMKNALVTAKNLNDQLKTYTEQYNSFKSGFETDLGYLKRAPAEAQKWIEADYHRALSLAKLPDLSVKNVAKLLFGQRILDQIETITGYIGAARYYANKFKSTVPQKETPPRLEGQYIHFGKHLEPPKFWIKKMDLSGELANGLQLAGNAENIVSNQQNIGQPTQLLLGGQRSDRASLNLDALLDYREETSREKIQLNLENFSLDNTKLSDFAILPAKIAQGKGYLKANIDFEGGNFQSGIQFTGTQIRFAEEDLPKNLPSQLAKISRAITGAMSEIQFTAGIQQIDGRFNFNINSNLDNLIAGEIKQLASDEVIEARRKLEEKVNRETEKYKNELDSVIQTHTAKLTGEAQVVGDELNKYQAQVDQFKKDIEKKIEKETKGKLLDLFKKN